MRHSSEVGAVERRARLCVGGERRKQETEGGDDGQRAGSAPREMGCHAPILPRRGTRGALIRATQPRGQQSGGLVRCPAVEGHERGRHAGDTHDVRAPTILRDVCDFDQIWASCDGLFEAMHDVVTSFEDGGVSLGERRAF